MKFSTETKEHWIEASHARLSNDRALWALADALAKDWCSKWGGWPDDPYERLAQRCSMDTEATRTLEMLMGMPDADRRALAHRLWPAPRLAAIAKAEAQP